jgi:hypothetical protein
MSSKPVLTKLDCDLKETQTNHDRLKLIEILKVFLENMFPEKYHRNQNIGPFKNQFRLSIFQINYLIDDIDYRTALLVTHPSTIRAQRCLTSVLDVYICTTWQEAVLSLSSFTAA